MYHMATRAGHPSGAVDESICHRQGHRLRFGDSAKMMHTALNSASRGHGHAAVWKAGVLCVHPCGVPLTLALPYCGELRIPFEAEAYAWHWARSFWGKKLYDPTVWPPNKRPRN